MSYDFILLPQRDGMDTVAAILSEMEQSTNRAHEQPITDAEYGDRLRLAQRLLAKWPTLTLNADVSRRHCVELNTPPDGSGVQISLYPDQAAVSLPYRHERAAAEAAVAECWGYLRFLTDEGNYVIFDQQLDRMLDLERDLPDVLASYTPVVAQVESLRKPWWKFW